MSVLGGRTGKLKDLGGYLHKPEGSLGLQSLARCQSRCLPPPGPTSPLPVTRSRLTWPATGSGCQWSTVTERRRPRLWHSVSCLFQVQVPKARGAAAAPQRRGQGLRLPPHAASPRQWGSDLALPVRRGSKQPSRCNQPVTRTQLNTSAQLSQVLPSL